MNKTALGKVSEQLGLTYNATDKIALGQYRGYKIVVKENQAEGLYNVNFPMKPSDLTQPENMNIFLSELLQDKKKVRNAVYEGNSLKVDLVRKNNEKQNITNVTEALEKIEYFASRSFYQECCEGCAGDKEIEVHLINDKAVYFCEECYGQVIQDLESKQQSAKQKKGNFITGIVGAFLGSLIGVALWVVIYALGYIAAIAGIVLAVCIIKGYELFGGKLDILGIVITIAMTIGMVYVATYMAYVYQLYIALQEYGDIDFIQTIRFLGEVLSQDAEYMTDFIMSLVKGYIFTAIGSVSTFISAYKVSNNKYSAKKISQ